MPNFNPNMLSYEKHPLKVVKVKRGLYKVENVYSGKCEYFKGRPPLCLSARNSD